MSSILRFLAETLTDVRAIVQHVIYELLVALIVWIFRKRLKRLANAIVRAVSAPRRVRFALPRRKKLTPVGASLAMPFEVLPPTKSSGVATAQAQPL